MKDISDKLEGRDPEKFKSSGGQLDMIPNAENADFLGTFSLMDNAFNADAKSMVTYAVTARSGLLAIDLAIPKEHLMQAIAAAADKQGDSQTAGLPALPSMGNFTLPDFTMDPNALPPAMPMPSPVVNDQQDQVQISDSMREHGAEAEAEIAAPLAPVEPDYSKSVSFQLRSAYQKQRDGQFDEAMLAYRSILLNDKATDSYMARTYCRMAECYREKNNTPQAIAQFNFVLDNFPKERYSVMKAKAALKDIEKAAAENDSKQDNEDYYNYDE
jgi:tetratricopeptide (TPR) repeat protein